MIKGYKCFNDDMTNKYGYKFEVGKVYKITSGNISFGYNGFHMCQNLEDTLRFFDAFNKNVCICEVIGEGKCLLKEDEYNGYYDMYAVERLQIVRLLSRQEILDIIFKTNEIRVSRFVQLFKLTTEEKLLFQQKYENSMEVINKIEFYQNNNVNVYSLGPKKWKHK